VVSHAYLNPSNNIALQSNVDPFAVKPFTFEYRVGGTVHCMPLLSGMKLKIACGRPLSSKVSHYHLNPGIGNVYCGVIQGSEYKAAITGRWYVVKLVGKNKHHYVKEWQIAP
jgi:hypothetical protein